MINNWTSSFDSIKDDIDMEINIIEPHIKKKPLLSSDYYTTYEELKNIRKEIFGTIHELRAYIKANQKHIHIVGLRNHYIVPLITISFILQQILQQYTIEKVSSQNKILNISNEKEQQIEIILATIITFFFFITTILQFHVFKKK